MTALTASPVSINFHGANIPTFNLLGIVRVAMRPICDSIGLEWHGQRQRINRNPVLKTCAVIITSQLPGDSQRRNFLTLPLTKLNGWLFGVDASRVKPEVRDKLVEYQAECFEVLSDYWQKGQVTTPRTVTPDERAGLRAAVTMLTTKRGLMHSAAYSLVHHRFNVEHIDELTPEQLPEAVEYVHRMALEGDYLGKQNLPAPAAAVIDYPLAQQWDKWKEHQLVGMDAMYHSDLRRLLAQLNEAARTGATLQIASIANAQEEFKALLHLCELRGIKGRHLSEKLAHIQNVLSAR